MTPSFKAKLLGGFILAFLAGGAMGAFLTMHQSRHWRADFGRHSHSLSERMRTRIKSQLDLTPEQLNEIRAQTGAKVRQVMVETERALEPELTDAERARLGKLQHAGWDKESHRSRRRAVPGEAAPRDDSTVTPRP
jgi:hypothetical protein